MKNFREIEEKWQTRWQDTRQFEVDVHEMKDKHYLLTMFPYPSGDKLHMGHWYQYSLVDSWARFKMMSGTEVFQPMGFDAFGLPAENFAIKKGIHPDQSTSKNVSIMKEQFVKMGVAYSWDYLLDTSKPNYYKWTQWIFLQLHKAGLAYKKNAPVNWCNQCQTVLANEQVKDGGCERCDSIVTRKNLNQWFFKVTDYAEKLLKGLETLDWPQKTLSMQKNWIGKSTGSTITFKLESSEETFSVFTTRPDTLFGTTYVTLAPEHPLIDSITTAEQKNAVDAYREETAKISEIDRLATTKEKTGVFTGSYAINPINGEKLPIWIGDYVLITYGTGAVMAVPAHDERDFEYAKKFNLPIRKVVLEEGTQLEDPLESAYIGAGILVQSGSFDGLSNEDAKAAITEALEKQASGKATTTYRLRDWLVSRQRYWGCPIPIIYCDHCGEVPVPEEQLPVELPQDVSFKPTGESPLRAHDGFMKVACPKCGRPAEREADTLDTFVCSSWYYLRFPSSNDHSQAFDKELTAKMLPVDKYVGGAEHACMHLLYARFFSMALKDLGYLNFDEPFPSLIHQGTVLGADGNKMSKSKGNAISPDPYVEKHGADVLRLYLAFGFNYVDGGPWEDGGFVAVTRFLDRTERLMETYADLLTNTGVETKKYSKEDLKLLYVLHNSIKGVTVDTERFMFNTSIARLMELSNGLSDYLSKVPESEQNLGLLRSTLLSFLQLLAPFAPHRTEEMWEKAGHKTSIFKSSWPVLDESFLQLDSIKLGVMINGKFRAEIEVSRESSQDEVAEVAKSNSKVQKALEGKNVMKTIYVKGKMINFVAK